MGWKQSVEERGALLCITSHICVLQRINSVFLDEVIHEDSMAILAGKMEDSPATIRLFWQKTDRSMHAHSVHQ